jgi:ribosomal protein S18 acetylase RimI-like enzyme
MDEMTQAAAQVEYVDSLDAITPEMLHGFFEGWQDPPSPKTHLRVLGNSEFVILAVDQQAGRVVGFVNAISDGLLSAFIPLLEVLPEYRGRGIGSELLRRMLAKLRSLYSVDLVCDSELAGFYEACGMSPATAMIVRNHDRKSVGNGPSGR